MAMETSGSLQFENRSSKGEVESKGVDNPGSNAKGLMPGSFFTPLIHLCDAGSSKKEKDTGFSDLQICSSLHKTAAVMSSMLMIANSVRAAACEGECTYVMHEDEKKASMKAQIQEEDAACKEKMEQICKRWLELTSLKAPQELAQQISEQCKACDELIESKKSFAELIQGELKAVDEDYLRMFRHQAKDVDMLVLSMGSQVADLHKTQIEELCSIEADFMAQRKDMLLRNKAEIDALLKKVRNTEGSLKVDLTKRMEDYTKTLENIRTQDNEDYNLLKVRLETDIQILEQHLESMAAAYQLNTEKLDYNYAVLVERDHDNYVTAGQQKRKLTKQRDTLCTLKARHFDHEKKFLMQNAKLSSDYEKIICLLQDLQSKEHQLEVAQEKQHWQFVHMHHHVLSVLTSKLLQADKAIHEEQLGWIWHPPPRDIFSSFGSVIPTSNKGQADQESDASIDGTTDHGSVRSSQRDAASCYRLPAFAEIEKIWRSYSNVVSTKVIHVWASLTVALASYNQLLKHRAKLIRDVYCLSQEKKALQGALNRCTSSKATKRRSPLRM